MDIRKGDRVQHMTDPHCRSVGLVLHDPVTQNTLTHVEWENGSIEFVHVSELKVLDRAAS